MFKSCYLYFQFQLQRLVKLQNSWASFLKYGKTNDKPTKLPKCYSNINDYFCGKTERAPHVCSLYYDIILYVYNLCAFIEIVRRCAIDCHCMCDIFLEAEWKH